MCGGVLLCPILSPGHGLAEQQLSTMLFITAAEPMTRSNFYSSQSYFMIKSESRDHI